MPLGLLGHIDAASTLEVRGWGAYDGRPTEVLFFCDGRQIGRCIGGDPRPDLVEHAISPECGFRFRPSEPLRRGAALIAAFSDGSQLAGSPMRIMNDNLRGVTPLMFIHVPKTAGTSLRLALGNVVPNKLDVYGDEVNDPDWLAAFQKRPLPSMVFGHIFYGAHARFGVPARYATLLRHPVDRVISFYRHLNRLPTLLPGDKRPSLGEFVRTRWTVETNNYMCRMLAGIDGNEGVWLDERWLLDLAVHNVRSSFVAIGTIKRLNAFLPHLETAIGSSLTTTLGPIGVENAADDRSPAWSGEDYEAVLEANLLDLALYNAVRRLEEDGSPPALLGSWAGRSI